MAVFADGHLDFGQLDAFEISPSGGCIALACGQLFFLADRFDHGGDRFGCCLQYAGVAGAHHDLGREALPVIFRIGTDAGFGMGLLDGRQRRADIAFAPVRKVGMTLSSMA